MTRDQTPAAQGLAIGPLAAAPAGNEGDLLFVALDEQRAGDAIDLDGFADAAVD